MAFDFPNDLGPRKAKVRYLSNAIEPETNGIGADQRFSQPGDKYQVDVTYPPMTHDRARRLIAALIRAQTEETIFTFRQPGLKTIPAGVRTIGPTAVSANARVVPVAGGSAFTLGGGQFFSLIGPDGRPYLHATVQTNNVPGTIVVGPPLRIPGTVGLVLDFANVRIQGFGPKGVEYDVDEAHHYGISFSIKERK